MGFAKNLWVDFSYENIFILDVIREIFYLKHLKKKTIIFSKFIFKSCLRINWQILLEKIFVKKSNFLEIFFYEKGFLQSIVWANDNKLIYFVQKFCMVFIFFKIVIFCSTFCPIFTFLKIDIFWPIFCQFILEKFLRTNFEQIMFFYIIWHFSFLSNRRFIVVWPNNLTKIY